MSPNDMFTRISNLLSNDADLRKLDPKFKAEFDAATLSGSAKGSMFSAKMSVSPEAGGSKVELTVELPFHLALMKGMVEKTLQKKVDEVLA